MSHDGPRYYTILVCPKCGDGPLVFDPDGLDASEGMFPRATCASGHIVLIHDAERLEVSPS